MTVPTDPPVDLEMIRSDHLVEQKFSGECCDADGQPFPCDALVLLDEIERLTRLVADYEHGAHHEAEAGDEARAENKRLREELKECQRDNVIYRACANGYAASALEALMDMTGSYNRDNPWLGITAAVALLQGRVR